MKSAKLRRQITLLTLVVALGVAVYLNWQYAQITPDNVQEYNSVDTANNTNDVPQGSDGVKEALPDKNYGEAQLVSADVSAGNAYFEQARLTRSQTRDAALDTIQKSLKNSDISAEEQDRLSQELSAEVVAMTAESDIENLVRAKGFMDCVAFIDGERVQITVKTDSGTLSAEQVAQIRDVVLSKVDTQAKNITITEVK